jgi:two-component system, cell cycle sensor histidine kinase and response regulator CckA
VEFADGVVRDVGPGDTVCCRELMHPSQETAAPLRALDFISDGVMIVDLTGRIIYADSSLCRMLHIKSPSILDQPADLGGRLQFQGGLTFDQLATSVEKDGQWAGEATCQSEDRHAVMLDMRVIPLSDSGSQRLGTMMVARDVTRERSLEKQVIQSQQMELVENLSIGIAHEFKNLLTVIMAYASLLQDQMAGQPFQKDITKILEAAQTANELTSRLLSVTRHSAPRMEAVDVHDVLHDVVAMLHKTLPRNIALYAPEKTPLPKIHTDPVVLYRALLNLCLNARDAMPDGGNLSIEVDVVRVEKEDLERWPDRAPGAYITISVTDTGYGMTPEIKQHIFEPFFTTKKGGTGLGLSVVQHTIRAMGGWVTMYSEPNLGACFRVYIPAAGQEETAVPSTEKEETPIPGGHETILVVDDDPLALNITQRLLHKAGYTVWTASGGEEAINLYRQHAGELDIVLLDVVMPYVNGEEVYHELVRINPRVLILVISGFTPKTAERLLKISGARFLSKPFSRSRLCAEVREILDTRKK